MKKYFSCSDISIHTLQEKYFFNRDYFNRLLKENSGYTFQQLRQNARLTLAAHLLKHTNLRVEDIANQVGYENLGYFYRIFYERYGKTPREYRCDEE